MYGYIYMTINKVNGKRYIGQHKAKKFDRNYKGSGTALWNAIRKYGWKNFKVILLDPFCEDQDELNLSEQFFIEKLGAISYNKSRYYNIRPGGLGGYDSQRIWVCKGNEEHYIPVESLEVYEKQGYAKGRNPDIYSEEYRRHMSEIKTTENLSEETRRKISEKLTGPGNGMFGRTHSEESRRKISESHKGKPFLEFIGTCWLTNGIDNIRVKYNESEEFLKNNPEFHFGMTHRRNKEKI